MKTYKRAQVAMAAYSVVVVFFIAYIVITLIQHFFSLSNLPPTLALVFATLLAIPLALTFIWERLTSVKFTNILEINLTEITAQPDKKLSVELEGTDPGRLSVDGIPAILENIKAAISEGMTKELIGVNLGNGKLWWTTRLYLLAALAEKYTETRLIVFNEDDEHFMGMVSPTNICIALGTRFPTLAKAYRKAYSEALSCDPPKGSLDPLIPSEEAMKVSQNYANHLAQEGGEGNISKPVTKQLLQECLKESLIVPIVKYQKEEYDITPPSPLLLYDIISNPAPFVALVDNLKPNLVTKLVNRQKLANQVGHAFLRQQLKPIR
jgi:hypothetical protein